MKTAVKKQNIPKGWEQKQIKDLLDYERPDNYIVKSTSYADTEKTPVLTANKSFILGYTNEDFGIYKDIPAIIFDDFTTDCKYVDFPFKVKSSAIKILKNKSSNVDLRFVFEKMKSINFPTGSHKRFYISQYQDMEVPVPPLAEQKKIAEILVTMDTEIQKTVDIIDTTEKLKRGLMEKLFTRGIGHTKFKKTKLGNIPEGWEVGSFTDLADSSDKNAIKPGPFGSSLKKSFYVANGYKIYGQEQVISGDASVGDYYIDEEKYQELKAFKIKAGDVLISLVGTIGKILIVPEKFKPGIINPRLLKITPDKNKTSSLFVAYLLDSDLIRKQLTQHSHGGTMSILNKSSLLGLSFGVPPKSEQEKIAEILSVIDEKISINQKLKVGLTLLKKGLVRDLLSGEKRTI